MTPHPKAEEMAKQIWSDAIIENTHHTELIELPIIEGISLAITPLLEENSKRRCEHCGSDRIYHGPPDCPGCGAPNCCRTCCQLNTAEMERDKLLEEIERLKKTLENELRQNAILERENAETNGNWVTQNIKLVDPQSQLTAMEEKLREGKKWMKHGDDCILRARLGNAKLLPGKGFECTCGLDTFLATIQPAAEKGTK